MILQRKNNNNKTCIFFVLSNVCFLFDSYFVQCDTFLTSWDCIVKYKNKWDGNPIVYGLKLSLNYILTEYTNEKFFQISSTGYYHPKNIKIEEI